MNEPIARPNTSSLATPEAKSLDSQSAQFVGFVLGDQHYAFRIEQIREIVILGEVTATPQVAEWVEGVSNLRGTIIPIINLRGLMGLPRKEADLDTRTIVVQLNDRTLGCTVDSVTQVIRIPLDQIQDPPDTVTAGGADYISGFAKLEERLFILLDINLLLDTDKFVADPTVD